MAAVEEYVPGQLSLGLNPSAPSPDDVEEATKLLKKAQAEHAPPQARKRQRKQRELEDADAARKVGEKPGDDADAPEKKRKKSKKKEKKTQAGADSDDVPAATDSDAVMDDAVDEAESKESEEQRHLREKRTVFVGNVHVSVQRKQLAKFMSTYGTVESVRFRSIAFSDPALPRKAAWALKKFHEKRDVMNAYVVFASEEGAQKAIEANGVLFMDKHLRVDSAVKQAPDNSRSVFIGNMPYDTQEEEVRQFFASCGTVTNVRLIRDRVSNIGKGFGYVQFLTADSVDNALAFHGASFKERELRVFKATDQSKKKPSSFVKDRMFNKTVARRPSKSPAKHRKAGSAHGGSSDAIVPMQAFRGEKANAKSVKMYKKDRPKKSSSKGPAKPKKSKSKDKGNSAKKAKKMADKKVAQSTGKGKPKGKP